MYDSTINSLRIFDKARFSRTVFMTAALALIVYSRCSASVGAWLVSHSRPESRGRKSAQIGENWDARSNDVNSRATSSTEDRFAISVWENEGGALSRGRGSMHSQYGRRIERDGSWTVYHVFSGVPAEIGGWSLSKLDEASATKTMIGINARNVDRRRNVKGIARNWSRR